MARKLVNTKEISHEDWLALRKKSLGGSEVSAILGMNPYSSPLQVYANKKNLVKDIKDNEAMRLGRDLEDYVAKRYTEATGNKVRNDHWMYMDDEYDYLTANIDRRIVGQNAALECKVMGNGAAKYNFDAGEVPEQYYCQCQFYCMILGLDRVDLAVLVLQRGIKIVPIKRNDDFIATMRKMAIEFWQEYVLKERMPDVDGSDSSMSVLKEIYPKEIPDTKIRITGLDPLVREYNDAAEMEKYYHSKKQKVQEVICQRLGDNAVGIGIEFGVSWKTQTKASISASKLKAKYPKVYADMVEVSEYRVFRKKKLTGKEK